MSGLELGAKVRVRYRFSENVEGEVVEGPDRGWVKVRQPVPWDGDETVDVLCDVAMVDVLPPPGGDDLRAALGPSPTVGGR